MKRFFIIIIILNICTFLVTSVVASHNAVATGTASVAILPPLGTILVTHTEDINLGSFYLPDQAGTLGLSDKGDHYFPSGITIDVEGTEHQVGIITISGLLKGGALTITLPPNVNLTAIT